MGKLKSLKKLLSIVKTLKEKNKKIVFTNGCFDIIHPGHIKLLSQSKKKGDVLIVGLNSDRSIRKLKGKTRPILNQKGRVEVLEAIEYIDYIVIFNSLTPLNIIKKISPDYLVKGGDWKKEEIVGREYSKKVVRINLKKNFSTTGIIKKIKKITTDEKSCIADS